MCTMSPFVMSCLWVRTSPIFWPTLNVFLCFCIPNASHFVRSRSSILWIYVLANWRIQIQFNAPFSFYFTSFSLCLYQQCDQIGQFVKVLGDMVSSKSSPNRYMVYFWAKAKSSIFNVKLLWLICGQLLEKFGLLFNLSSGHAVCMTHTQA